MSGCAGLATAGQEWSRACRATEASQRRPSLHHVPRPGLLASPTKQDRLEQTSGFPGAPPHMMERQGGTSEQPVRLVGRSLGCPSLPLGFLLTCQLESAVNQRQRGPPPQGGGRECPPRLGDLRTGWALEPCPVYGGQGPTLSVRSCWSSAQDHMGPPWRKEPRSYRCASRPRKCRSHPSRRSVSGAPPGRQWPLKILFTK